jgi:hypothetical protein
VHERQHTGQTMSQVMAAFRERFNGHVTKAYVSDSKQFMVAYWSVYGDFSATLYMAHLYGNLVYYSSPVDPIMRQFNPSYCILL